MTSPRVNGAALIEAMDRMALRVFTTGDVRRMTGQRTEAAARALERLRRLGRIHRLRRGLWVNRRAPGLHPYEAVPYLRGAGPAYVSLMSVLSDRGVVAEIPAAVAAVTAANPRRYRTPLGEYRYHHLPVGMLWGFTWQGQGAARYPVADPEKALLDTVYLALARRSPVGIPRPRTRRWAIDSGRLRAYARRLGHPGVTAALRDLGAL